MKIYDISLAISPDLPVWPGDPGIELTQVESIDQGSQANVSHLSAGVHIGTHVDAPHHFMNDSRTVEQLSLDVMIGSCFVTQLPDGIELITADVLESIRLPENVTRILFGTSNSKFWSKGEIAFQENFVAISEGGAQWLVDHDAQLVGVDYLSVAPYGDSVPTHRTLLGAGIIVVEGLDLSAVPSGFYELFCLPLKLLASDGAPARAILVQRQAKYG